jgi:hypothetical protein
LGLRKVFSIALELEQPSNFMDDLAGSSQCMSSRLRGCCPFFLPEPRKGVVRKLRFEAVVLKTLTPSGLIALDYRGSPNLVATKFTNRSNFCSSSFPKKREKSQRGRGFDR